MAEQRVHTNCVYRSNPYHKCVESCLVKMEETRNPQKSKKSHGSLIRIVPRKLSMKKMKKGSDSELKSSKSFDSSSELKKALASNEPHISPTQFSFKKVESWNCELPFSDKPYSQDSSFLKFLPRYKPALNEPPCDEPIKSKLTENDQHADDGRIKNNQIPEGSLECNIGSNSDKGSGGLETPEIATFSDSRVLVGDHYYAKGSDASILRSILNKHGDIARNCKLTSKVMCSYYLECLCLIIQDLQSSAAADKMSKPKLQEILAVVKDVEAVGIEVGWLRRITDEIVEAVELVEMSRLMEAEKERCVSSVESVRKDLEARMQDLAQKEEEAAAARAQVEETREQLSKLELECARLNENMVSIQSKMVGIECKAKVDEIV
ncbi:hypothetical protein SAY86_009392 [Trapa natans]|uniref:Phospholipase-like protein (PEARLI 4) family protein n=1 Tax=Trapa natans TaxID=22666 RepID=A0AAN7L4S6_TRANT|nr:hypothetical protein SAY86_009392 [Trapa natans]